jgi:hypothetical protein
MTVRRTCQQPFYNYFEARVRHPFAPYRDPDSRSGRVGPFEHLYRGMVQALRRPPTSAGARAFLSAATSGRVAMLVIHAPVHFQRCCGQECPMPLGFDPPHPGGMIENSPTFQRWVREFREAKVPKGLLKPCTIYQPSLRDLSCRGLWFPTLKRWAIIVCPSGTKTWPGFAGIVWKQILAALDRNVRAPGLAAV